MHFVDVPQKRAKRASPVGDDESSEDSGDEYVQERAVSKGKAKVKRRRRGDAGADGGERRPQRKRKRKQQLEEIDLSQLPPEQGALPYNTDTKSAHECMQPTN